MDETGAKVYIMMVGTGMTRITETAFTRIAGVYEPVEYVARTYTICDACGSEDISYKANAHLPDRVTGVLSIVIFVSFYGGLILGLITHSLKILGGLVMMSIITFLIYYCLASYIERNNHKNPKCNQCGNTHIT